MAFTVGEDAKALMGVTPMSEDAVLASRRKRLVIVGVVACESRSSELTNFEDEQEILNHCTFIFSLQ